MSNSSLVTYTKLSPNCNKPRKKKIDTITIHCFVGQVTAKEGCNAKKFVKYNPIAGGSCNYVVGHDGSIGLCVEEANRSWCSSNKANDHRAITIEVASETKHPYAVTDKAYSALIELVTDICKRNDIKKLLWKADKKLIGKVDQQNMTVHRWFANKACPGDYLYNKHGEIANEVNKRLGVKEEKEPEKETVNTVKKGDVVSIVAGATYYTGKKIPSWVRAKQWIVASVKGDRAVLGKSTDGKNNIQSAINTKYLSVVKTKETEATVFEPYKVKVATKDLIIRQGAGTDTKNLGTIPVGVYTIVEERNGTGAPKWGRLKSGAGWIPLDCVKRV